LLRNPQSLAEIGVDKNTLVFPAPLMDTIGELGPSSPGKRRHSPH